MPADERILAKIDTSRPSIARVYDAMLGGKDNFEVDRELYDQIVRLLPDTAEVAEINRKLLTRVVRWLARSGGVDQFLDLGSGLPTAENTHQVAQRVNPDARVVYVDNDPSVIAHGRALLEDNENTHFCAGDLTRPNDVLTDPTITGFFDFDRPIAILQFMTLHHVADTGGARRAMATYVDRLASGSYVALTHFLQPDQDHRHAVAAVRAAAKLREASRGFTLRTKDEITSLLPGLELVDPGMAIASEWWPDGPSTGPIPYTAHLLLAGVGRKP